MSSKRVLFVAEGKTDIKIIIGLYQKVLGLLDEEITTFRYKTNIYVLYDDIIENPDATFLSLLWEKDKSQFPDDIIKPDDTFSSVYLIFDFEPQDPLFSLMKCQFLINYFADETRNGKLYYNYPMLESIYDFTSLNFRYFENRLIPSAKCNSDTYKAYVHTTSKLSKNGHIPTKLGNQIIYAVILLHMRKHDCLAKRTYNPRWPQPSSQEQILKAQKKCMKNDEVSIINTSVLLIPDYSIDALNALKLITYLTR
ncbi:MAG: hypothetical protein WC344_04505 [Bacilli bacterium]|jgi:hypothetical protein